MAKFISPQQLIGERGRHLFSERILSSGLSFHPTAALDAGIDGFLELRDPTTGEVKAQFVSAQLKTQEEGPFSRETPTGFSWQVESRDLDYWLQSNLPVILVVIRLSDQLIVWKSIQDWFCTAERRASRRVEFDRRSDELTAGSASSLATLVSSFAKPGLMVPPMRARELLDSNLLASIFPDEIRIAPIEMDHHELRSRLLEYDDHPPIDWIVYGKRLVTFRDLSEPPFVELIDSDLVELHSTRDWTESDGSVTKRQFVELLRRCLSTRMQGQLSYYRTRGYLYFRRNQKTVERKLTYQSFQKKATRHVVKGGGRSKSGEGYSYFRHAAFYPRFIGFAGHWYLAIEPTYHFTSNGYEEYPFAAERLAGIKRLETNQSVRGHIGLWLSVLTTPRDLLQAEYSHLKFQPVSSFPLSFGVPDDLWRPNEEEDRIRGFEEADRDLFG